MLSYTLLKVIRMSGAIRAIGTTQNVNPKSHSCLLLPQLPKSTPFEEARGEGNWVRLKNAAERLERSVPHCPTRRSNLLTFSGLSGTSVTVTPNGRSASSTAAANAAADGIVPPSPAPFTPKGLRGQTTSTCAT